MTTPLNRRVVVTGLGAVSNVGTNVNNMWKALTEGRSGISAITAFEQDEKWNVRIAGEIRNGDSSGVVDPREAKRMDRFCIFGLCAADEAAKDSGIDFAQGDPYRRGVAIGSGIGGIITIEDGHRKLLEGGPRKISPFTVPKLMVNACAGNVSIRHDLRGANTSTSTACATGAHAIGAAFQLIQRGDAEIMFAGGAEAAISPICVASFAAMKALSTRNDEPERASRPFDRDRDGFVLAEGASVIILEELEHARARGAEIYAEVLAFGSSGDAGHIAAPDPQGAGAKHAMRVALDEAQINAEQIDHINAHGTSTPLGDAAEIIAIKSLFKEHAEKLIVSSTKSMTGHTLGAAGCIESVATILAVHHDLIPPTINLDSPDDAFADVQFAANVAVERTVRYAMNNSFGFGGHNVTLCFGKYHGE